MGFSKLSDIRCEKCEEDRRICAGLILGTRGGLAEYRQMAKAIDLRTHYLIKVEEINTIHNLETDQKKTKERFMCSNDHSWYQES